MSTQPNSSQIAAKMDMALDDIIKEKKNTGRKQRGGRGVGNRGRGRGRSSNVQSRTSAAQNVFNRASEARTDRISQLRGIQTSNNNNTVRRRTSTRFPVRRLRSTWTSQQRQREINRRKKEQSYQKTANNPFAVNGNQNNQIRVNVKSNNNNAQPTQRRRVRDRSIAQAATLRSRAVNQARKAGVVAARRGIQNNNNNTNAPQTLNERFSVSRPQRGTQRGRGGQRGRGSRRGSRGGRGSGQQTGPRTVSIIV